MLADIHGGDCGHHSSSRTLVGKAFRSGFYRPTTLNDAVELVKACEACQFHARQIHQPAGGTQGQATEIEIAAKHILRTREKLNHILAENTGRDYETICADTERDNWMSAQEAMEYGIIDKVYTSRSTQSEK